MPKRRLTNVRNRPSTLQGIQLTAHQLATTETKMYVSMEELWFHFFVRNDNLKQNEKSYLNENEIIRHSHMHFLICIIT